MTIPDIPRAVLRAIRLIEAHGSVTGVTARRMNGLYTTEVTVNIKTELANTWRAAGKSPSGVRAVEPASFVFLDSYPMIAPVISLRDDFDRSHPHLLPGSADESPQPCLVAGSPREVLRVRGISGLIEQIVEWLERAAYVNLIDPEEGWEPTRRDHIDDIVVADASWLTAMPTREGGCSAYLLRYVAALSENRSTSYLATLARSDPIPLSKDLSVRFKYRNGEGFRAGDAFALVAWSGKKADGTPYIADRYAPETVTTIDRLLERASDLGVGKHLSAKLGLLQDRLREATMTVPVPLVVILLARRPLTVIGTGSDIELCPYIVELSGADALSSGSTKIVRTAAHRDDISVPLLRRASADHGGDVGTWSLIGCGSIGSKLAVHMARMGRGPKILVDRGNMQPHNYARHALLPTGSSADIALSSPKATLLNEALAVMKQPAVAHDIDIVSHIATKRSLKPYFDETTQLVVNTTAAASVRESLTSLTFTGPRPRLVEACVMGIGKVGVFTVEGPDANPSTVDLICETYAAIHRRNELRDAVFGEAAAEIAIGQGCSTLTLPLSDSRLSMFAAPMAERLADLRRAELPPGGLLMLGLPRGPLGLDWVETAISPRLIVKDGAMEVRISPEVDDTIKREIDARAGSETGGIIYGRYCDVTDSFHVVGTLPAPPDSEFSADEFVLGTQGLRPLLTDLIDGSGGALYPLGTWHNHLVPSGPSLKDMGTAVLLSGMQFFPLLMLIRTPRQYEVLTVETLSSRALSTYVDKNDAEIS